MISTGHIEVNYAMRICGARSVPDWDVQVKQGNSWPPQSNAARPDTLGALRARITASDFSLYQLQLLQTLVLLRLQHVVDHLFEGHQVNLPNHVAAP